MQNSIFWYRIVCLYGYQTSSGALWMQNNVSSTRVTSLWGSQPSSVVFGCKIATLEPEILFSMGPNPHLWFLHSKQRLLDQNNKCLWVPALICGFGCKTATLGTELQVSMGRRPQLSFCACKTARLALELLVSMGPSTHLRFLHAKQRL